MRHFTGSRVWPNQAGQPLPRAFAALKETTVTAAQLRKLLAEGDPAIIAYSENRSGVYLNPMCLAEGETEAIIRRFREIDSVI